jgi:uncharacterized membrane protein
MFLNMIIYMFESWLEITITSECFMYLFYMPEKISGILFMLFAWRPSLYP